MAEVTLKLTSDKFESFCHNCRHVGMAFSKSGSWNPFKLSEINVSHIWTQMLMMADIFSICILLGWIVQNVNFKDKFSIITSCFLWLLLQKLFSAYNIILVFFLYFSLFFLMCSKQTMVAMLKVMYELKFHHLMLRLPLYSAC